jgi:sucrose-6-phosphate hydrolase SacC (GH32 family)
MKDGLENSFKKALNDFEYPYDANAWDALNQKLSPKKWYQHTGVKWSAALVVVAGITALFFARNADERKTSLPTTNANSQQKPRLRNRTYFATIH